MTSRVTENAFRRRRCVDRQQQLPTAMRGKGNGEKEEGNRSPCRLVNWRNGSEKRGFVRAKKRTEVVNVDDAWITMYWRLHHSPPRVCVPRPSPLLHSLLSLLLLSILWENIPPPCSLFHLLYWNNVEGPTASTSHRGEDRILSRQFSKIYLWRLCLNSGIEFGGFYM